MAAAASADLVGGKRVENYDLYYTLDSKNIYEFDAINGLIDFVVPPVSFVRSITFSDFVFPEVENYGAIPGSLNENDSPLGFKSPSANSQIFRGDVIALELVNPASPDPYNGISRKVNYRIVKKSSQLYKDYNLATTTDSSNTVYYPGVGVNINRIKINILSGPSGMDGPIKLPTLFFTATMRSDQYKRAYLDIGNLLSVFSSGDKLIFTQFDREDDDALNSYILRPKGHSLNIINETIYLEPELNVSQFYPNSNMSVAFYAYILKYQFLIPIKINYDRYDGDKE